MRGLSFITLVCLSFALSAQTYTGNKADIDQILTNVKAFSNSVMQSDVQSIGLAYTSDAKIFPNNKDIIKGREAIIRYWTMPEGVKINYHKITPEEIKILGDEAYDYGYYEGTTLKADGSEVNWKGKYVIVWKKIDDQWQIYLDIWNAINNN